MGAVVELEWMARRACDEGVDPELFFPASNADAAEAKEICGGCQVAASCLNYALNPETRQDHGVWGRMTESERAALLRRRARPNDGGQRAVVSVNEPTTDEWCGTYAGVRAHRKRAEWLCDECRDARAIYENERRRKVAAAQREAS